MQPGDAGSRRDLQSEPLPATVLNHPLFPLTVIKAYGRHTRHLGRCFQSALLSRLRRLSMVGLAVTYAESSAAPN